MSSGDIPSQGGFRLTHPRRGLSNARYGGSWAVRYDDGAPNPHAVEGAAVSTQSILGWIARVTSDLLPSPLRTLAGVVAAAVRTGRPNLTTAGRRMAGPTTARSAIRRARRFAANPRIEAEDATAGPIARLVRKRKQRLLIGFGRTDVRQSHTPM